LLGVRHGEPFETGHSAKSLIGCDEDSYKSGSLEPERNRELQSVERAKSFDHAILDEQLSGSSKVLIVDGSHY
jgi:hypothetical protein